MHRFHNYVQNLLHKESAIQMFIKTYDSMQVLRKNVHTIQLPSTRPSSTGNVFFEKAMRRPATRTLLATGGQQTGTLTKEWTQNQRTESRSAGPGKTPRAHHQCFACHLQARRQPRSGRRLTLEWQVLQTVCLHWLCKWGLLCKYQTKIQSQMRL